MHIQPIQKRFFIHTWIKRLWLGAIFLFCSHANSKELEIPGNIRAPLLERTLQFFDWVNEYQYQKTASLFQPGFQSEAFLNHLSRTWQYLEQTRGEFQELTQISVRRPKDLYLVCASLRFLQKSQGACLFFSDNFKIERFELLDVSEIPPADVLERPYILPQKYTEENLQIGTSEKLSAKLFLPKEIKNPPVVIFVHDFGPQDLWHRVGINGFFRDFALGLASSNVACLVYPKRSHEYTIAKDEISPQWEVLQDVYSALYVLKNDFRLKKSPVYLLAYGFSTWFTPWLDKKNLFDGFILLNPSFRHPAEILFEIEEFMVAHGSSPGKNLQALNEKLSLLLDSKLQNKEEIFGYPASYFYQLNHYEPQKIKPNGRFLTLFASKDFVRNSLDPKIVEEILGSGNYDSFEFEHLNRIFHSSETENPNLDFLRPGLVSAEVILLLKNWIHKSKSLSKK